MASFEEIQANEFNLNIPRYVDTFEEEELIDIEEDVYKRQGLYRFCSSNWAVFERT